MFSRHNILTSYICAARKGLTQKTEPSELELKPNSTVASATRLDSSLKTRWNARAFSAAGLWITSSHRQDV